MAARAASRPRVLCLEWLDPYYVGGHWVPEMVAKAGGEDVLGRRASRRFESRRADRGSRADVIVVMPCGYNFARAAGELRIGRCRMAQNVTCDSRGSHLRGRRECYFSRPGPRLADGVALLAHLIHPDLFPSGYPEIRFAAPKLRMWLS